MPVPLSPFSGVNMCVSPSGPVPTGQERVATVFTWTHGGKNVAVTGTWNNWQGVIPLNRSEHDFTAIIDLPPGVHQYKFIVDGKWTHAADQPVATDSGGNINNCMEIKEFRLGQSKNNALGRGSPPGSYTQEIPELIKFNDMFDEPQDLGTPGPGGQKKKPDEPPVLPPHLLGTRAVLNTTTDDPTVLPLPNHVMLNHLYFRKHEDDHKRDILILGTTQRYKEKFVTTVFYKAAPALSDVNSGSTTTSPSVTHRRPPPPLDMTGQPATSKPVARQLFSPRDGAISDSIGSPRRPAADDGYTTTSASAAGASAPLTNHPTMALTMDRGTGGGTDGGGGGGGGATRAGQGGAPGTTTAMDIVARRRVSVSGDGAVLGRSPVQDEGAGLDGVTDVPVTTYHADYSLRQTMG